MAPGENEFDTPALGSFMLSQMVRFHSFLWPSNIPLYIRTIACVCTHLLMNTGGFHILAIVNTAAMNMRVRILSNWF